MIKITTGYVTQTFDEATNRCTGQEFHAEDGPSVWEYESGEPVEGVPSLYHPFEMYQPGDPLTIIREVSEAAFRAFESLRDDHVGADLAYLIEAIANPGDDDDLAFVDWSPECNVGPLREFIQENFEPEHGVWKYIRGCDPCIVREADSRTGVRNSDTATVRLRGTYSDGHWPL